MSDTKPTIKETLLYAGTSEKNYNLVRDEITDGNREKLRVFTSIAAAAFAAMILMSLVDYTLVKIRTVYLVMIILCVFLYFLTVKFSGKSRMAAEILVYTFLGILYLFGIVLATVILPDASAVSYVILTFALPLIFTDRPLCMIICSAFWIAVYFIMAWFRLSPEIFQYNISNVLAYGVLGMIVGTNMMKLKVTGLVLDRENRNYSEIDQLTGLWNRRCYEMELQSLRERGLTGSEKVCAMDLNGLKRVNDTLGHSAGDELIRGAADCIREAYGLFGKCYRTGGDEFMVVIEDAFGQSEEVLKSMLSSETSRWKGEMVPGLSLSVGIASAEPEQTVDELAQKADQMMYADKSAYYRNTGFDRRRR